MSNPYANKPKPGCEACCANLGECGHNMGECCTTLDEDCECGMMPQPQECPARTGVCLNFYTCGLCDPDGDCEDKMWVGAATWCMCFFGLGMLAVFVLGVVVVQKYNEIDSWPRGDCLFDGNQVTDIRQLAHGNALGIAMTKGRLSADHNTTFKVRVEYPPLYKVNSKKKSDVRAWASALSGWRKCSIDVDPDNIDPNTEYLAYTENVDRKWIIGVVFGVLVIVIMIFVIFKYFCLDGRVCCCYDAGKCCAEICD